MSPTVFKYKNYRFFFFSLEEKRIHVHVDCPQLIAHKAKPNFGLNRLWPWRPITV
jgi:hypothetical protein